MWGGGIVCAAITLISACTKVAENADSVQDSIPSDADNLVTINASIPDKTKISITQGTATGPLAMAWQAGDKLVISDHIEPTLSEVYTINAGFTPAMASFTGKAVSADKFDILYGATSVSAANAMSYVIQNQSGNASTAHLKYLALLSSIGTYTEVSFTSAWAGAHGAQFKQSGFLRVRATLPGGITSISKLTVTAPSAVFYTTNAMSEKTATLTLNFNPAAAISPTSPLVAYFQLPWGDNALTEGTVLTVTADDLFTTEVAVGGKTLAMGAVNDLELELEEPASDTFAGGTGTESDPYLIGAPAQMMNIAGALVADATTYFKLIDNINMAGKEWTPLNTESPYNRYIDFNGNNKTITNLTVTSDKAYPSLFGILNGSVKDLTISNSTIEPGGNNGGVLAGYIGERSSGVPCSVSNVNISNCTVGSASAKGTNYCGGLCSTIEKEGTVISNVTVMGTNVFSSLAGGVVGFADGLVTMSGCLFTGGTVTASAKYSGGLLGSTGNYASVISGCRVENATIDCTALSADARCGGLIGQIQKNVTVKGCSVGTPTQKVTIKAGTPSAADKPLNIGGFAGTCYGKVTQDGTTRCKAYITVTSTNAEKNNKMQIGGFGGYIADGAQVEYSDAIVEMSSLIGTHVGGFAGIVLVASTTISNCTSDGSVGGNNYCGGFAGGIGNGTLTHNTSSGTVGGQSTVGGFVGVIDAGTVTYNSSSASLTPSGSNNGGFVGTINGGTITNNHATGNISASGGSIGGFVGQIGETKTVAISKCYATGNVEGTTNCGGLIGYVGGNLTLSDCYATGNVGTSSKYNQKYGGLIGFTTDSATKSTSITITNCYATGAVIGSFASGGLIGRASLPTVSVSKCAAWSASVTPKSASQTNWSSGAVCGVTHPNCIMTDNYRNPLMTLAVYCPPPTEDWDHPNINGTTTPLYQNSQEAPFTWDYTTATAISAGTDNLDAGRWAYHGKHVGSGTTLSQLASTTLGWSSDVWDFSGSLPTLK